MTWRKGQSGNPAGRARHMMPDGRSVAEWAREYAPAAFEALLAVMNDSEAPHQARVQAAIAIHDRAFGRPQQAIELDLSADESVAELLRDARKRVVDMLPDRAPLKLVGDAAK
ncbi:MAG TPA: hypothetical protein VFG62_06935 [Rhodopila sp.]|jgi:hypothetical protein|nr:hypothetical protein [Rhodopila sp.]